MKSFDGKIALVTGSSRGIGKAAAIKLASLGADIAVHCLNRSELAGQTCDEITALGCKAVNIQADITDRSAVSKMIDEISYSLGAIDLLVNNAAAGIETTFEELTPEIWDRMIAVNLTGLFNVIWAVKDSMIKRKFGRIVNLTSLAAWAVRPNITAYSAAKAGVISLTKSLCEPFAKYNIRINAIAPGLVDTDVVNSKSSEEINNLCSQTPLGRMGTPDEIADVVAFLLGEESSYITGTTVVVSGGRLVFP